MVRSNYTAFLGREHGRYWLSYWGVLNCSVCWHELKSEPRQTGAHLKASRYGEC